MKKFLKTTALTAVVATGIASTAQAETKYTFYHILWGMTDANVQFHVKAGESYMASHPEVEIKYVGPENYDPAEHAKFLDTVINAAPNGIAMHISSVDALLPGMKAAHEAGIPFVSVTSHPPSAEDNAKIDGLFLTWTGANEEIIGEVMAKRVLQDGTPTRVAYLMAHLGHAGQEQRADGFFGAMPEGVAADKLAIGEEPQKAKDIIRSYVLANPDVTVLFTSAPSNKWVADVIDELGRNDIKMLTSDEAPTSLECVLEGYCLATFSQQFPIQAPFAYDALLHYNETGMAPVSPILTGPAVVDASNAQQMKDVVMGVLGEDAYYDLSPF
ncbi:MAG: substrate-binding domain-containing protein [Maritimibacter sp.]|nr:substrate-binding domain-containing protein [Maritimibacter sp.]